MNTDLETPTVVVLARIDLVDFRNYGTLNLDIGPGLNVLFGENAQGKTNILEAVHLVATTRLLRGSRESEAVRDGQRTARVAIELAGTGTELAILLEAGRRKTAQLNRMSLPKASDLIGRLPTVCVSLSDMEIVRGEPGVRRLFLDLELSQLYPAYLNHLAHYKRALEQRNALLRTAQEAPVDESQFEPWEAAMAEHGAAIRVARMEFVKSLEAPAAAIHERFGGGERISIRYEAKDPALDGPGLLAELRQGRDRDIARGSANFGPQRDDLGLFVEERDIRYFGSQGQQRTAVLALKLASFKHQTRIRGTRPLLLLDDMLSDLDEGRRRRLVEWVLIEAGQAVLTCTEPEAAGPELLEKAGLFQVQAGKVSRR